MSLDKFSTSAFALNMHFVKPKLQFFTTVANPVLAKLFAICPCPENDCKTLAFFKWFTIGNPFLKGAKTIQHHYVKPCYGKWNVANLFSSTAYQLQSKYGLELSAKTGCSMDNKHLTLIGDGCKTLKIIPVIYTKQCRPEKSYIFP